MANEVELEKVAKSVFGITSRRYRQMANDEVVPPVLKGKIDFVAASKALIEYYRKLAQAEGSLALRDEQAALTGIKKEREKLKLETERGNLVERDTVLSTYGHLWSECRLAFRSQPRRLAGSLAALSDEREIESILRVENDKILKELARPIDGERRVSRIRSKKRMGRKSRSPG